MPSHPVKPALILVMGMVGGAISGLFFSAVPFLQAQSTSPLTIQPDTGRVGIGTTAPTRPLHVISDGAGIALRLGSDNINYAEVASGGVDTRWDSYGNRPVNFSAAGSTAMTILPSGNVGIGTLTPAAKLQVAGDAMLLAQKKVNSSASTYYVNTRRYHVEATKATVLTTVPLDMTIVNDLCKDEDGCAVTLGMRNWNSAGQPGLTASQGPYRFFISQTSNWSRLSNTHAEAADGNGTVNHILQSWDCYFTDGEYVSGANSDSTVQLGLLNWNSVYNDPNMVCVLDIED